MGRVVFPSPGREVLAEIQAPDRAIESIVV